MAVAVFQPPGICGTCHSWQLTEKLSNTKSLGTGAWGTAAALLGAPGRRFRLWGAGLGSGLWISTPSAKGDVVAGCKSSLAPNVTVPLQGSLLRVHWELLDHQTLSCIPGIYLSSLKEGGGIDLFFFNIQRVPNLGLSLKSKFFSLNEDFNFFKKWRGTFCRRRKEWLKTAGVNESSSPASKKDICLWS